jgi:hypothetical protein
MKFENYKYIILVIAFNLSLNVWAQDIIFGNHKVPVGEISNIAMSNEEIRQIDSLTTNNDSIQIIGFSFVIYGNRKYDFLVILNK